MAGITHYDQFTKPALRGLVDAMENERKQEEQSLNAVESLVSEENVYSHEFAYDVIKKSNQIAAMIGVDRKSTRLNSSHVAISYDVFCLQKKIPLQNTIV